MKKKHGNAGKKGPRYADLPCGCPASRKGGMWIRPIAILPGGDRYCGTHRRIFRLSWAEVVATTILPTPISQVHPEQP